MKFIADMHTHSIANDHAYSTIDDNAHEAARKGLIYLGITEHACSIPGAPSELYFMNLKVLPEMIEGVHMIYGAEVNVMDFEGSLDLKPGLLKNLSWVIASMHDVILRPGTEKEHTLGWLEIAKNPYVDMIGHCNFSSFPCDYDMVVKAFGENGKIVELNAHHGVSRRGKPLGYTEQMLEACRRYSVPIIINSDAHYHSYIGDFEHVVQYLKEIKFPEELVINTNGEEFEKVLKNRRK